MLIIYFDRIRRSNRFRNKMVVNYNENNSDHK